MALIQESGERWAKHAIRLHEMGQLDEAGIAAYEAGRYGMKMPAAIADKAFLKQHFERGLVDAVQDAEDAERANAIADAGFDPAYQPKPQGTSRSPGL